jgi:hypothetical protein
MHIIIGDAVNQISDSYTVLELDTFKVDNSPVTTYCVIEKIPLEEFTNLIAHKDLHQNLIKYYRLKQWNYCEQAISELLGKWNGEVDTFYADLLMRIQNLKNSELDKDWDGILPAAADV